MLATLLLVASFPFVFNAKASAAQLQNRSIQMSDSSPSGNTSITSGVGSGTNVTYRVTFTPSTNAKSLVIDFCTISPIIGDSAGCTAPTGMVGPNAIANVKGTAGDANWTIADPSATATGTGVNNALTVKITNSGTTDPMVAGVQQVFDLTGITNPSSYTVPPPTGGTTPAGTFYGRIYTWANNAYGYNGTAGTGYQSPTQLGTGGNLYVDYGGIALSTVEAITITARVQEQLTFCVTTASPTLWTTTHGCDDPVVSNPLNAPNLTIGHGTPTAVLTSDTVDTADLYSSLSTNATYGATVNLHNSNACGGLSADGGTTCDIAPVASTPSGAVSLPAGDAGAATPTGLFGLYVGNGTLDSVGGVGPATGSCLNASAEYHDNSHTTIPTDLYYGMDTAATNTQATLPATYYSGSTAGTNGPFGNSIESVSSPVYRCETSYVFAATAALTTPAGIYSADMSMIATGTF
jgi:hypothetical protein